MCKTYKLGTVDVEVLKNIDLTIESGEFASIMGPSGSGKSTLLYLIGGLDKPTSGSVRIASKPTAAELKQAIQAYGIVKAADIRNITIDFPANVDVKINKD